MIQSIKQIIKKAIHWDHRKFNSICSKVGITLDYQLNKDALRVLETVFKEQEYALHFPFQKSATILDVGGHYGYFSFYAAKNLHSSSRIIALEPSPLNHGIFTRNLAANSFKSVEVHQCGLGSQTTMANLFAGASYNHSLIQETGKPVLAAVQLYSLEDFMTAHQLDKVDFLKLDCEGVEYEILLNCSQRILEKIEVISLEFHDRRAAGYTAEQLVEKLKASGFKIMRFLYEKDVSDQGLMFGKIVVVRS